MTEFLDKSGHDFRSVIVLDFLQRIRAIVVQSAKGQQFRRILIHPLRFDNQALHLIKDFIKCLSVKKNGGNFLTVQTKRRAMQEWNGRRQKAVVGIQTAFRKLLLVAVPSIDFLGSYGHFGTGNRYNSARDYCNYGQSVACVPAHSKKRNEIENTQAVKPLSPTNYSPFMISGKTALFCDRRAC